MKNLTALLIGLILWAGAGTALATNTARVRDLTLHQGDVPRRLVGYGLVVGLEGTGDRSFGGYGSQNPTVHSVVNLLRRFDVEVPSTYLRLRNVAAVLVTAEVSPFLRAGGRFEVQVSAIGDARSLEGGVLWMTPLISDPGQPPLATAQGPLRVVIEDNEYSPYTRQANSGRIPEGGIVEVDQPLPPAADPRLILRTPDRLLAVRITEAVNRSFGDGSATVEDPGSIKLTPPDADGASLFLASIDTLSIAVDGPARVIIHGREGTVVAGGDVRLGEAVVHHHGYTLQVGGSLPSPMPGMVRVEPQAMVQDVAAGLHALGARPEEIASIFEALRDAGALNAEVIIR